MLCHAQRASRRYRNFFTYSELTTTKPCGVTNGSLKNSVPYPKITRVWNQPLTHVFLDHIPVVPHGTAQGGGGSFKKRKPIGEVNCCESRMAERIHWWTERWLECRVIYLSIIFSIYLSIHLYVYLPICLFISFSIHLSIHPSIYLSTYPSSCLSTYLSVYLPIHLSVFPSICLALYLSMQPSIHQNCLSMRLSVYLFFFLFFFF